MLRFPKISSKRYAELKKLYFNARKLSEETTKGMYRSAFRGQGMEFEEVREYYPGDDIRNIDWKVTARTGIPFVKLYREERELSVVVAADVSKSTLTNNRESVIAELGAVLTLIALKNNDKVGLALFGGEVRTYFPPAKSRSSGWRIIREVMEASSLESETNIDATCKFLSGALKTRSVIFLISDFIDDGYDKSLSRLARRHDVNVIRVHDSATNNELPPCLINVRDPEKDIIRTLDFSSRSARELFSRKAEETRVKIRQLCEKNKINFIDLTTTEDFMPRLRQLFTDR